MIVCCPRVEAEVSKRPDQSNCGDQRMICRAAVGPGRDPSMIHKEPRQDGRHEWGLRNDSCVANDTSVDRKRRAADCDAVMAGMVHAHSHSHRWIRVLSVTKPRELGKSEVDVDPSVKQLWLGTLRNDVVFRRMKWKQLGW